MEFLCNLEETWSEGGNEIGSWVFAVLESNATFPHFLLIFFSYSPLRFQSSQRKLQKHWDRKWHPTANHSQPLLLSPENAFSFKWSLFHDCSFWVATFGCHYSWVFSLHNVIAWQCLLLWPSENCHFNVSMIKLSFHADLAEYLSIIVILCCHFVPQHQSSVYKNCFQIRLSL